MPRLMAGWKEKRVVLRHVDKSFGTHKKLKKTVEEQE